MSLGKKDRLYTKEGRRGAKFVFDEAVAEVFSDMIQRSVPGYGLLVEMIGLVARRHLQPASRCQGGELVLEGPCDQVPVPRDRYARMRNVWFIPSPPALVSWLARCGLRNGRPVDVTTTSPEEQRSTPWMRFQSWRDFLDPEDPTRTRDL